MNNITAHIQMFGGFCISIGDKTISDIRHQSKKPWNLLEYLVAYRERNISAQELIDLIWADDQSINPNGALKTLIFRTRKLLDPLGIPSQQLLIQKQGMYAWNPEITVILDVDEFDILIAKSHNPDLSKEQKLHYLMDALALYKGKYLSRSGSEPWIVPIAEYYHKLFQNAAHLALELLNNKEEWETIITFCQQAILIDPLDELFHYNLIYALYNQGKQPEALKHYQNVTDLFYNKYSITPSERLKDLYKLIRDKDHGINTDLFLIQESMNEKSDPQGAYFCEYTVFRDFYQLNRRSFTRLNHPVFLCLLTISDRNGMPLKPFIITRAMTNLDTAISSSLRRGDVYSRYSVTQYLIMLPTNSRENAELVLQRIIRKFKTLYIRKELNVHYTIQLIEPAANNTANDL